MSESSSLMIVETSAETLARRIEDKARKSLAPSRPRSSWIVRKIAKGSQLVPVFIDTTDERNKQRALSIYEAMSSGGLTSVTKQDASWLQAFNEAMFMDNRGTS